MFRWKNVCRRFFIRFRFKHWNETKNQRRRPFEMKRSEMKEMSSRKKIIMETAYLITEMHSDYRIIHLCHNVWTVFVLFSSSPIMCVPASFCLISDYFVGKWLASPAHEMLLLALLRSHCNQTKKEKRKRRIQVEKCALVIYGGVTFVTWIAA